MHTYVQDCLSSSDPAEVTLHIPVKRCFELDEILEDDTTMIKHSVEIMSNRQSRNQEVNGVRITALESSVRDMKKEINNKMDLILDKLYPNDGSPQPPGLRRVGSTLGL